VDEAEHRHPRLRFEDFPGFHLRLGASCAQGIETSITFAAILGVAAWGHVVRRVCTGRFVFSISRKVLRRRRRAGENSSAIRS